MSKKNEPCGDCRNCKWECSEILRAELATAKEELKGWESAGKSCARAAAGVANHCCKKMEEVEKQNKSLQAELATAKEDISFLKEQFRGVRDSKGLPLFDVAPIVAYFKKRDTREYILKQSLAASTLRVEKVRGAYAEAHKILGEWPLFSEGQDKNADALVCLLHVSRFLETPDTNILSEFEALRELQKAVETPFASWFADAPLDKWVLGINSALRKIQEAKAKQSREGKDANG